MSNETRVRKTRKSFDQFEFGLTLIVVGCVFLLYQYQIIDLHWRWWTIWALFASLFGSIKIIRGPELSDRIDGVFQIALGLTLYAMFERMWGLNFFIHWPILLIGLGITSLAKYLVRSKE
ncbi:LiaF transmembrane domain-containing protein [Undibacterium fentianense]|uniref:LiaF transmembrane domain-containing protein n=1 Tax=Undibacterium fentianense TaxID=2828728 RepID=A0A941EA05_9BURK|nr:hypothetical protein [Undibacterium fentianense]MBR7801323.1 hypothetical protein [Undibacterium fentianense]